MKYIGVYITIGFALVSLIGGYFVLRERQEVNIERSKENVERIRKNDEIDIRQSVILEHLEKKF